MKNTLRYRFLSGAILCALWVTPFRASAAVVDLNLSITPIGGSFQYNATVTNNGPLDLTLVSLINAPIGDPLINSSLTAPAGFLALYDFSAGIIDFLENTKVFGAGTTIGGFSFTSAILAGSQLTAFEAIDINGGSFRGTVTTTVGPVAGVPDLGSSLILAMLALAPCFILRAVLPAIRTFSLTA